ncbi:hypothetical protein SESBI_35081 [Sesbania bispinosa]|nr:hypothetical protein SESBI_35081 [Sesbania bispinosa]
MAERIVCNSAVNTVPEPRFFAKPPIQLPTGLRKTPPQLTRVPSNLREPTTLHFIHPPAG